MRNYFIDMYLNRLYGVSGMIINNVIALLIPILVEELKFRGVKSFAVFVSKLVCVVIVMNLLCAASYALIGHVAMSQICGGILVTLWLALFSRSKIFTRLICGFSFVATLEIVLVDCFSVFDIMLELGSMNASRGGVELLMIIMLVGFVCFFKVFSTGRLDEVYLISVGLSGGVFGICTVFWVITNVIYVDPVSRLTVGLMLTTLLLGVYYSAYAVSKTIATNNRLRMDKLLRDADANMLGVVERNMEELRQLRHEIDNQYTYMKVLLDGGEYEKLGAYFSEYTERFNTLLSFVDCGNRVVSAVMNLELQKAAGEGITIDHTVSVPKEMSFSDSDICSLLFNLLNNAIEYLCRRRDTDRRVQLSVKLVNKTLFVSCANAIEKQDAENARRLVTSKPDAAMHGYGSKVIGAIAERYNGSVKYDAEGEGGRFCVSVMLFEPSENRKKA